MAFKQMLELILLPAHVSPVKGCSQAAMNGSKDNTSRLFRGLVSVFGTQLDHPCGPEGCFTDTNTHTVKHTH